MERPLSFSFNITLFSVIKNVTSRSTGGRSVVIIHVSLVTYQAQGQQV